MDLTPERLQDLKGAARCRPTITAKAFKAVAAFAAYESSIWIPWPENVGSQIELVALVISA